MSGVMGLVFNEDMTEVLLVPRNGVLDGLWGELRSDERRPRETMSRVFREFYGIDVAIDSWTMLAEAVCPMDKARTVFFFMTVSRDLIKEMKLPMFHITVECSTYAKRLICLVQNHAAVDDGRVVDHVLFMEVKKKNG